MSAPVGKHGALRDVSIAATILSDVLDFDHPPEVVQRNLDAGRDDSHRKHQPVLFIAHVAGERFVVAEDRVMRKLNISLVD